MHINLHNKQWNNLLELNSVTVYIPEVFIEGGERSETGNQRSQCRGAKGMRETVIATGVTHDP